jgi:HD-like signal output (HDOD) protein
VDKQIHYLVCSDYSSFALALRQYRDHIRLVLVGPELDGKQDMVVRLMGGAIQTVLVLDPARPIAEDPEAARRLLRNMTELGVVLVRSDMLPEDFYQPLVRDHVVAGLSSKLDIANLSPDERAELLENRLESVTMFPSLPETQNKVAALDDMDHPRKWAEAIDPDVPLKQVILNLLNSAHYSFRTRVKTVEQAVSLASTRTIREVVLACTVQRLFRKVPAARVDDFWKHSVATGFFAKLFSLCMDPDNQSPQDRQEMHRFDLDERTRQALQEMRIWTHFDLDKETDAFTSGLLHDIGKVTMALCLEDSLELLDPLIRSGLEQAEAEGRVWAESSKKLERTLMTDIDHEIIGGRIARRWGLDPRVQEVVRGHHEVRRSSSDIMKLVALADLAANTTLTYPIAEEHHPLTRLFKRLRDEIADEEDPERRWIRLEDTYPGVEEEVGQVLAGLEISEGLWKIVDRDAFLKLCFHAGPRIRRATGAFLQMTASSGY